MKSREERERDLGAMLVNDRPALIALYKQVKKLQPQDDLDHASGYDLVHQILAAEYSDSPDDEGEGKRWMDARSSM